VSAKVLVVDDSAMVRTQLSRVLDAAGFCVAAATDGVDALKRLADEPGTKLVVCDLNMPIMGGIELLEELRTRRRDPVPFVVLTTDAQADVIGRARSLGASGWMTKPLKPELLLATAMKLTATGG